MTMYEENKTVLTEYYPYMAKAFEDYEKSENEQEQIFWDKDLNGADILGIKSQDYMWYVNSCYDSGKMVQDWCKVHRRENYFSPILMFGIGNAEYLIELRNQNPDNPIYVYEPSIEIFMKVIEKKDLIELIRKEHLYLTFGDMGMQEMAQWLGIGINYANYEYIEYCILPNYKNVFPVEYLRFQRMFLECLETMIFQKNTLVKLEKSSLENMFSNIRDCIQQYSVSSLAHDFRKFCPVDEIPAILVSAGPSLDKNVKELHRAKNKAFILCVDTATGTLLKNGILPDLMITIDPKKDIFLFEQTGIEEIPMALSPFANRKVKEIHTGQHFYSQRESKFLTDLYERYGKDIVKLDTGGSVANDGFSLLRAMGFTKIILAGQDLAYPGNRSHAKAAYDETVTQEDEKTYFYVNDIYGSEVLTRADMNHYRRWFEGKICGNKELKVMDATEGGARIEGTEIISLKEAIDRECNTEFLFSEILKKLEPVFSEDERNRIFEELDSLPAQVADLKNRIADGKKLYEKLDELNRKGKYHSKEFKRTYQNITELNKWIDEDSIVTLIGSMVNKTEYEVQKVVYDKKENLYEEINAIAQNGIKMMEAYLEKVPSILELLQN